jgi:hypothetical protein
VMQSLSDQAVAEGSETCAQKIAFSVTLFCP